MSASDCPHSAGDAAAYALGALEPEEADAFRSHVESCVVCRDELEEFMRVTDTLPLGVPQYEAPRGLRQSVMREVQRDANLRRPGTLRRGPARRLGPRPGGWRAPGLALGAGLAAVLVAAAIVVGVQLGQTHAGAIRTISARSYDSPARAQLRIGSGHAELVVEHLPQPAVGHIYEVWLSRGRTVAPSSLFSPVASGRADVEVPGSLASVSAVLVTLEPARGSLHPTTRPIIVAPTT